MKLVSGFGSAAMALLVGCTTVPEGSKADAHAGHHPATAGAAAPAGYDQRMQMMEEMHRKMAAAKTPEERAALMKDHMKAMHDGMGMMGQMHGGTMGGKEAATPMDPDMMKRRMDMMEMMMQMMLDREGMKPPATK